MSGGRVTDLDTKSLADRLQEFVGKPYGAPSTARDAVNEPMIRHLTDALGDRNPVYTDEAFAQHSVHGGIVAPATSLQVWTMHGLVPRANASDEDNPQQRLMSMVDAEGYVGVVATNCEQTYHRYLRPGDVLTVSSEVESIAGPKNTGLGEGFFITTLQTFRDQTGEVVGEMRFRILKFKPANTPTNLRLEVRPGVAEILTAERRPLYAWCEDETYSLIMNLSASFLNCSTSLESIFLTSSRATRAVKRTERCQWPILVRFRATPYWLRTV